MSIQEFPAEILLQIFRHCSSISAAINLSLTCQRFYHLLRDSQKIPVLFSIAESVWGPLEDIFQLLTYNSAQPVHIKRTPVLSFALLVQVSKIGRVAVWFENMYPRLKWDGTRSHMRRELTARESYATRRAIYRIWLFDKAFHNLASPRTTRLNPTLVMDRSHLLRNWTSEELVEIEDVRLMLETVLANEICPTDGDVFWRFTENPVTKSWFDAGASNVGSGRHTRVQNLFHSSREGEMHVCVPASQQREQKMGGWGDEIDQYHTVNDMLKLSPADIMWLYEHAVTKYEVETFIEERAGGIWFWNNGETLLHTWIVVLHSRGLPVQELREAINNGTLGITSEKSDVE